jgi:uncharacterized Tic20 family protein
VAYFYDPASTVEPIRPPDERKWAAIAHLSVVFPVIGPLAVYWKTRREQPWAGRNALQALAFWMAIVVLEIGLILASMALGIFLTISGALPAGPPGMALCALPSLLAIGGLALSGYGAWRCFQGKTFRYPVVGEIIDGL